MKADLAGPDSSPLETLPIEWIADSWLRVGQADAAMARTGEMSIRRADHLGRRQDAAQGRHLAAIGAQAMVRRLLGSGGVAWPRTRVMVLEAEEISAVVGVDAALGPEMGRVEGGVPELVPLRGEPARADVVGNGASCTTSGL